MKYIRAPRHDPNDVHFAWRSAFWTVFMFAMVYLFVRCTSPAQSQDGGIAKPAHADVAGADDAIELEQQATLVAAALLENSWRMADAAAQWFVMQKRAKAARIPIDEMARRYDSGFSAPLSEASAWKLHVTQSCDEPEQWPASEGNWERQRGKCIRMFDLARRFLHGQLRNPCPGASQFGSRTLERDRINAAKHLDDGSWKPASCNAKTVSAYYLERRR